MERSGLCNPERIDRLLLVAITLLVSSLQGYALSFRGLRRQMDPRWWRGLSFARLGVVALQSANQSD